MQSFEELKAGVIESARVDWQINGNGRGELGVRLAEFAYDSEELNALDRWVWFGWDGISMDDWDCVERLADRQREQR